MTPSKVWVSVGLTFLFGVSRIALVVGLVAAGYYYFAHDVRLVRAVFVTGGALILCAISYVALRRVGRQAAAV